MLLGLSPFVEANEITIALENKPWSPHYFGTKKIDQKNPGVLIELLSLVEKSLKSDNLKFKYKRFPWKRCISSLKKNYVDAVLGASFKKSRMEIGEYPMIGSGPDDSKALGNSTYSFYKLKSGQIKWDGKKFSNLAGSRKIGVTAGYSIGDEYIQELIQKIF